MPGGYPGGGYGDDMGGMGGMGGGMYGDDEHDMQMRMMMQRQQQMQAMECATGTAPRHNATSTVLATRAAVVPFVGNGHPNQPQYSTPGRRCTSGLCDR